MGSPEKCGILWVVLENLGFHKYLGFPGKFGISWLQSWKTWDFMVSPGKFGISWVILDNLEFDGSWKTWYAMSRPGKQNFKSRLVLQMGNFMGPNLTIRI